jgi:hypothetical protein
MYPLEFRENFFNFFTPRAWFVIALQSESPGNPLRGFLSPSGNYHTLRYVLVSCPVPRSCPSMACRSVPASTIPEGATESSSAQTVKTYRWVLPGGGQGPVYPVFRPPFIPLSSPPVHSWSEGIAAGGSRWSPDIL